MEMNKHEVQLVLEAAHNAGDAVLTELADLELACIGGGVGEIVLS